MGVVRVLDMGDLLELLVGVDLFLVCGEGDTRLNLSRPELESKSSIFYLIAKTFSNLYPMLPLSKELCGLLHCWPRYQILRTLF